MRYNDTTVKKIDMVVPKPSRHVQVTNENGIYSVTGNVEQALKEADECAKELQLYRRMLAVRLRLDGLTKLGAWSYLERDGEFNLSLEQEVVGERAQQYAVLQCRDLEFEAWKEKNR